MKNYNNFRRTLLRTAASVLAAAALMAGCTKVDDTLGGNPIPEIPQMRIPIWLAAMASTTVLIPTASAPRPRSILISAGDSKEGPVSCT